MRLRVTGLGRVVKRDLGIEFGREQLTSYGGLELMRRYFQSRRHRGSPSVFWDHSSVFSNPP